MIVPKTGCFDKYLANIWLSMIFLFKTKGSFRQNLVISGDFMHCFREEKDLWILKVGSFQISNVSV